MTTETDSLNHNSEQRWYILGAGAIGCLWACALRQAGEAVSLIVREHRLKDSSKPQQQDLQLTPFNKKQSRQSFNVELITAAQLVQSQISGTHIHRLIIATKAYDAIAAVESVLPCLAINAKVISLCNGMGMHETILAKLRNNTDKQQKHLKANQKPAQQQNRQLYLGVTSDGSLLSDNYQLTHTGQGETFIGEYLDATFSATVTKEAESSTSFPAIVFNKEKFFLNTQASDDVNFRAWQKLLINCAINPLTAKYHCKNGELLSEPALYQQLIKLCDELANIYYALKQQNALADNSHLSDITAESLLNSVSHVATQTMANSSSMLKDKQAGRRLELDYLNCYIVKLAAAGGLACPINGQLIADLTSNSAIIN